MYGLGGRAARARRRCGAAAAWVLAAALTTTGAGAQSNDVARARDAYDAAIAAASRGDHALAAAEFARADRLAPNPVALESALKAAVLADDPPLGMALVERAAARTPRSAALDEALRRARKRFEGRAGRLRVGCPAGARCRATVDGQPADVDEPTWVAVGEHAVEIDLGGRPERRTVRVDAGATVTVEPANPYAAPATPPQATPGVKAEAAPAALPPARPAAPTEPRRSTTDRGDAVGSAGLSPVWVLAGAGATAALGAVTVASAVDTKNKHDAYERSALGAEEGRASQTRTNVLFAATAVVGLATAGVALFAVRWSGPATAALRVDPAGLALDARF